MGTYFLFLGTAIYFYFLATTFTLLNSTLSQFGIYLLLPGLFLSIPVTLNKNLRRMLVMLSGFLIDYNCALPLGFSVFFLISIHFILEDQFKLSMVKSSNDRRIILISVNLLFFITLFILSKFDRFLLAQWHPSNFLFDLLVSSIVLFFLLPIHFSITSLLEHKFFSDTDKNPYLIK